MIDLPRRLYRRLMTMKSPNHFAWRSAYAGKWDQWCKGQKGCKEFNGPRDLHEHLVAIFDGPINYLEFGVHKGTSLKLWVEKNQHPDSLFVGFDSFEGLPEDWNVDYPKGHFTTDGKTPDILDERCSFQVGWFHETLPKFVQQFSFENLTVVHLDADLYGSTLFVLCTLAPKLKKGDVLIFDDFSDTLHVFRAFTDFLSAYPLEYDLIAQDTRLNRIAVKIR